MPLYLLLLLAPLFCAANESEKVHAIKTRLQILHNTLDQFNNVDVLLQQRLPQGCNYELLSEHPTKLIASVDSIVVHVITGRRWTRRGNYPQCTSPSRSIFLTSLQPEYCFSAVDFEWVECGGHIGSVRAHSYRGQTYVYFCRESVTSSAPLQANWIDGSSGLCSVFPTNWVPPPSFFLDVEVVPLEEKAKHVLVTSAISHSYTPLRQQLTHALMRRNVSFHRFGKQERTISIHDYLQSLYGTASAKDSGWRAEKENAIRWSKFHLALEHSSQNGYMSEKVWQCLRVGTVPIYYGAPEARFFLPPRSTVFVNDYSSYDELIDYLLYLDRNDSAYLKYLQWRDYLTQPHHPYTTFLNRYGQGELFTQHLCMINTIGFTVLQQIKTGATVAPFLNNWTDWSSGRSCSVSTSACNSRKSFIEPPTTLNCNDNRQFPLLPYGYPSL